MKNTKKIMIVEDDSSISEMYKIKFEKEWFEVLVCENWLQSLSKIVDFRPNIILLDIMMPQMDWFEVLKAIKELTTTFSKTKIIIFSNLNSSKDIEKWLLYWADDYILKAQVTPKELIEKLQKYI